MAFWAMPRESAFPFPRVKASSPRRGKATSANNGVSGERNGPFAVVLGHAHHAIYDGLADSELAVLEVDVLPPKAEQLSEPEPGV